VHVMGTVEVVILREPKASGESGENAGATRDGGAGCYPRFSRLALLDGRMTVDTEFGISDGDSFSIIQSAIALISRGP
ncbi:MAG: hypothetical protein WA188_18815, partial [Terriglobales bacterium]